MDSKKRQKNAKKNICDKCDFTCNKLSDWNRHISTAKHKMIVNDSKNGSIFTPKNATPFVCECGKSYKYDSGYYRHKKKCYTNEKNNNYTQDTNILDSSSIIDKEILVKMLLQNQEVMNKIVDILPQIGMNNSCNK